MVPLSRSRATILISEKENHNACIYRSGMTFLASYLTDNTAMILNMVILMNFLLISIHLRYLNCY